MRDEVIGYKSPVLEEYWTVEDMILAHCTLVL
jgi:hypothetical protein